MSEIVHKVSIIEEQCPPFIRWRFCKKPRALRLSTSELLRVVAKIITFRSCEENIRNAPRPPEKNSANTLTCPWKCSTEPTETSSRSTGFNSSRIALTWALYGAITPISSASITRVNGTSSYQGRSTLTDLTFTVLSEHFTIVTNNRCLVYVKERRRAPLTHLKSLYTMEDDWESFLWQHIRLQQHVRNVQARMSVHTVFIQIPIRPCDYCTMRATIQMKLDDPA